MSGEMESGHAGGPNAPQEGFSIEGGRAPAGRKRRRWRLKLILALGLLAAILLCLPSLVSTGPGTRGAVWAANLALPGRLCVEDVSLSWRGPCVVRGMRLDDPAGREVIGVPEAALAAGMWQVVTSPSRFGQLTVKSPRVGLYLDEDGRASLLEAVGAGEASAAGQASFPLPALSGRLAIRDGSVQVVRADGRELAISRINGDVSLEALSDITGRLVGQVAEAGTVAGEIDVRRLARQGRFQPLEATGTARLSTPADLSLAGLGKFVLGSSQAAGSARIEAEAVFGQGEVKVEGGVALARLQVPLPDSARTEPIDVRLSGRLRATRASLTAQAALEGQIGEGQWDVTCPWSKGGQGLSLDDMVSAALAGKPVTWPEVLVEGKSRIDLARLARAVPALLRIRSNVVVTGGELEVERVVLRGGEKPSTTGSVVLRKLASRRDGPVSEWEPVSLAWDARIEPGTGLRVERAALESGFARLTAQGSPSDLHADFQGDLARLHQQASQVFDLGDAELAGGSSGTLDLKKVSPERLDLVLSLTAEGLRYGVGRRHLEVGRLSARKSGYFTLAGSRVTRLTISEATWDVDGRVAGTGSGWTGIGDGAFDVEVKVSQGDVACVAGHLAGLGVAKAAGYGGQAAFHAKVRRESRDSPVVSEGTVVLRNIRLGDEPLLGDDATFVWSGLSFWPAGRRFEIRSAELTGAPARLSATGVNLRADKEPVIEGKVEGSADVGRCLAIGSRIAGREKPPAIAGRLSFSAVSRGTADGAKLDGDARIDGFAVGEGDRTIREDQVRLAVQASLDRRQEAVTIDRFQMDSRILAMKATGKVFDFMETCRLDLSGDYRASWEAVTALIHEWAPATAETLSVAGVSESRFTVTGTARQPQVRPLFREASGSAEVGWASASICGVEMGQVRLRPALQQGRLTVPVSAVPAAGGQVRIGGGVDFRPGAPVLSLGPRLEVLENVRITPELGRSLLSRVNPVFGSLARAEGAVSLVTENIEVPLGGSFGTGGSGRGRLDLRNLKVQPVGWFAALLELGGLTGGGDQAVQVSSVDFYLKDGRLWYENFALTFGRDVDLRFRGSVGFDDTVDLAVSVPVRPVFLERLGVGGPTGEYARRLEKVRVEIPISGTRWAPSLDLAQVDLKPLIEEAARSAVARGTDGLLSSLLGIQRAPKREPAPIGPARSVAPRVGAAGRRVVEQGKAQPSRAVPLPEPVRPGAARSVRRDPEVPAPTAREAVRRPAMEPAGGQEVVRRGASRPAAPVVEPAARTAVPERVRSAGVPRSSQTVTPAARERARLPVLAPTSRPVARGAAASLPAPRGSVLPRPAVRGQTRPPASRPASRSN